ncbi:MULTISPECIES: hypothetical protein [Prochlorococcus]|nr:MULTISPECIES: hypothetical protein [Prochlorococcus]
MERSFGCHCFSDVVITCSDPDGNDELLEEGCTNVARLLRVFG